MAYPTENDYKLRPCAEYFQPQKSHKASLILLIYFRFCQIKILGEIHSAVFRSARHQNHNAVSNNSIYTNTL